MTPPPVMRNDPGDSALWRMHLEREAVRLRVLRQNLDAFAALSASAGLVDARTLAAREQLERDEEVFRQALADFVRAYGPVHLNTWPTSA